MKRRRTFLTETGLGFTGLALGAMLQRDTLVHAATEGWQPPDGKPHFAPKAKRVIWLFMIGGASQMETFDPKPALNKYAGKTVAETPFTDIEKNPFVKKNLREVIAGIHSSPSIIYPMQVGHKKYGQSGLDVSDWFPHVGGRADDLAVVRSMWTTDNNHGAQLQFHTGRHVLEGQFPTIGAWVHYGLGALNENLPQFVVLGEPIDSCCGGPWAHGAHYLGPEHDGVQLKVDAKNPLPFASPGPDVFQEEQEREFALIDKLNRATQIQYPHDPALRARIKSYELAFRMQTAVPDVMRLDKETEATRKMYGIDEKESKSFGEICLSARRLAEQGTRFIQIFHGAGGAGAWDAHSNLKTGHEKLAKQTDKPIAGLLADLKQRGMLDDTLVVWCTEFGRTPGAQNSNGRDHHPYGFSIWLSGGGVKGGTIHGATDELGFHAIEDRHYVTDLHATVLKQMGLDARRLEVPGRKRIDVDFGTPIHQILA
jgi:hypothetical protein